MIQVRVRAFHLDHMARCTHNRVTCTACGLDPFAHPTPHRQHGAQAPRDHSEVLRFSIHDGSR